MKRDDSLLTGKTDRYLVEEAPGIRVHKDMHGAFQKLRKAAAADGFDLCIASGFRDQASQLRIWNAKAKGERPLLDAQGKPLEHASLSREEILFAILRWSALPGASRHHWGTDIDVYDKKVVEGGYTLQLIPQEAAPGGPFEAFNRWLGDHMEKYGFFRPYVIDRGGVSPEWWHLSYAPLAEKFFEMYDFDLFEDTLEGIALELRAEVMDNLTYIFNKYVRNITLANGEPAAAP